MPKIVVRDAQSADLIAEADFHTDVVVHEGNYYLLPEKVDMSHLEVTDRTGRCHYKGEYHWIDLVNNGQRIQNVAWVYPNPMNGMENLANRIAFQKRSTRGAVVEYVAD